MTVFVQPIGPPSSRRSVDRECQDRRMTKILEESSFPHEMPRNEDCYKIFSFDSHGCNPMRWSTRESLLHISGLFPLLVPFISVLHSSLSRHEAPCQRSFSRWLSSFYICPAERRV